MKSRHREATTWGPALILIAVCGALTLGHPGSAMSQAAFPGVFGADDRRPVDSAAAPWTAVGRVNIAGYRRTGSCTGTLIAPDLVVTAAHCLFDRRTGKPFAPGAIHFVAGQRGDSYLAHSTAKCVRLPGGHVFAATPSIEAFKSDVAVLVLKDPMQVEPVRLLESQFRDAGIPVTHAGYGRDRKLLLTAHRDCRVKGVRDGLLFTDCDTNHGGSGGPVLARDGDGYRLVATMAGVIEGRYSVAVGLSRWRNLLGGDEECR